MFILTDLSDEVLLNFRSKSGCSGLDLLPGILLDDYVVDSLANIEVVDGCAMPYATKNNTREKTRYGFQLLVLSTPASTGRPMSRSLIIS